jgi:hypothetical protein
MRRRLVATTKAPAMGPKIAEVSADAVYGEQVKKKTMSPAVFGRHGAFGVSAGKGGDGSGSGAIIVVKLDLDGFHSNFSSWCIVISTRRFF